MPMYEYQCDGCGATFEVLQKFSDPPLSVHQECGGKVERLISPPGLHFKGSGWYVTDYARSSSNGGKNGDGNKSESKPSETKAEAKPASSSTAPAKKD